MPGRRSFIAWYRVGQNGRGGEGAFGARAKQHCHAEAEVTVT